MISSIQGSNQNVYMTQAARQNADASAVSKASDVKEVSGEEELVEAAQAQPDVDTVEISDEGMAAYKASQSGQENQTAGAGQGAQMSQSAPAGQAVTSTDSSDTSTTTSDLSQYTESELKDMLDDGEITQAEYNAEIRSREAESEAEESELELVQQAAENEDDTAEDALTEAMEEGTAASLEE